MSKQWSSKPIQINGVCVDVHASAEGVVLGESAGTVLATDLHMPPEKADELAKALTQGSAKCRAMREGE